MSSALKKLLVNAADLAEVITSFINGEIPAGWIEWHPRCYSQMCRIVGEPFGYVSFGVADSIVCAMGCPHVLANGRVEVVEGDSAPAKRTPKNGYVPAAPFQAWLREYAKAYPTLTAMYVDLDMPYVAAKNYMKTMTQYVPKAVVVSALARAEVPFDQLYPNQ